MRAKDKLLNNSFLNKGRGYKLHPCFIGTAEEVFLRSRHFTLLRRCFAVYYTACSLPHLRLREVPQVVKDCSPNDPPIPDTVDKDELVAYVRGPISFIEDDPGRQMIGSFHPIDDDEWAKSALFTGAP